MLKHYITNVFEMYFLQPCQYLCGSFQMKVSSGYRMNVVYVIYLAYRLSNLMIFSRKKQHVKRN